MKKLIQELDVKVEMMPDPVISNKFGSTYSNGIQKSHSVNLVKVDPVKWVISGMKEDIKRARESIAS